MIQVGTVQAVMMKLAEIDNATAGKTTVKSQAHEELVPAMKSVAAALSIIAKKLGDMELKAKAKANAYRTALGVR